jgi:hypothetical protein
MRTLSRLRGSPETPRHRPRSVAAPAAGAARPGLRERGKLDKRERIRAAARELSSSHGFEAATLRKRLEMQLRAFVPERLPGARCDAASGANAGSKPSAHQHPAPLAHGEKQGGRR